MCINSVSDVGGRMKANILVYSPWCFFLGGGGRHSIIT